MIYNIYCNIYIYIFMCNFLIKPNVMGRELWVFLVFVQPVECRPTGKQAIGTTRAILSRLATSQSDFVIFVPLSGQG